VIDDCELIRETVGAIVKNEGYIPLKAEGAQQALDILDKIDVDLILMDVEMPGLNGFDLTRKIRESKSDWMPIIFLSGHTDDSYLSQGIDAGGDDYLLKPVNSTVLAAKIRAMSRITKMKAELDEANLKLLKLTHLDALTEIVNRRGLDESLKRFWKMSVREQKALSIAFIDIDHFKPYNDNYGHQQGDECLRQFSKLIERLLERPLDMVARYGGEEFVVVLPETSLEGAVEVCERIISTLAKEDIEHKYSETRPYLTASIGIATSSDGASDAEQLLKQADTAVYQAKRSGRNKYVSFSSFS